MRRNITTGEQNKPRKPPHTHPGAKIIKSIQTKLRDNNAVIARADKGNSIVIFPKTQYQSKIQDFLHANNFHTSKTDPTKTFQTQVRKTVKNSKQLIPQEEKWKYINLNPAPRP